MQIENIKIYPCFKEHPPSPEKMSRKEWLYAESGFSGFDIILNKDNYLIDGYCGYLIAKANGLTHIPARYEQPQIVRGCHKPGGKLYTWKVPKFLCGHVSAGERLVVPTRQGIQLITVVSVEDYVPGEDVRKLKTVICKTRKERWANESRKDI